MTDDPAMRRQLRFALFLQAFAALMMGIAFAVRVTAFGLEAVTILLGLALVVILIAAGYTVSRLRRT